MGATSVGFAFLAAAAPHAALCRVGRQVRRWQWDMLDRQGEGGWPGLDWEGCLAPSCSLAGAKHGIWMGKYGIWMGKYGIWMGKHGIWMGKHGIWMGKHGIWMRIWVLQPPFAAELLACSVLEGITCCRLELSAMLCMLWVVAQAGAAAGRRRVPSPGSAPPQGPGRQAGVVLKES
jgi:hypothetical protein